MDFRLSAGEMAYRDTGQSFFRENPPPGTGRYAGTLRTYCRLLAERGWMTMHWPMEHGGQGASAIQQVTFKEECFCASVDAFSFGTSMVGPTLLLHVTDEQKQEHLPGIAADTVA